MSDTFFDDYRTQAASLKGTLAGFEPAREAARAALEGARLPSQKSEAFRYSALKALKAGSFALAQLSDGQNRDVVPGPLVEEVAGRIVYINGRYCETSSDTGRLAGAAMVRALSNYFSSDEERSTASTTVDGENADTLALIGQALARDGIAINVPAGTKIEAAVELVHVMDNCARAAAHPRHVIELGEGAELTLIERYVGDESDYWLNETLSIRISEGAKLTHVRLVEEGAAATQSSRMTATVDAGGLYHGLTVALSGAETRFEARISLLGEGAHAATDAVLMAGTGEAAEMLTHVTHGVPRATSDQVIRAIASGRGKTSFQGKITVAVDAQETNADQSVKSLLLDRSAEVNAKPELEIYADDVKCTHGATVGELDEKQYFYLLSRGIDPVTARSILIDAFTADALHALGTGALQEAILGRIQDELAATDMDGEAA